MSPADINEEVAPSGHPEVGGVPNVLPVLPLRDNVVLPQTVLPILVGRSRSRELVQWMVDHEHDTLVLTGTQSDHDEPGPADVSPTGVLARIIQMSRFGDGTYRLVVEGIQRVRLHGFVQTKPYLAAEIELLEERHTDGTRVEALRRQVLSMLRSLEDLAPYLSPQTRHAAADVEPAGRFADAVAAALNLSSDDRQELLEALDVERRLEHLVRLMAHELEVLRLGSEIKEEVEAEVDKSQREFLLRRQMEAIRRELGEAADPESDLAELRLSLDEAALPEEAAKEANREFARLERLTDASPEHHVIRTYLDWMVRFPWHSLSDDRIDVAAAREILDEDHYGLDKIKERILEYLAVRSLKNDMRGPIICLVGPPGVGKTSLGRSVARSLNREFVRLSLGGIHDEAELRGHRRTYIGSMPGRIVQSLVRAGTRNPVVMLDEVDKIGADYRGDPAAALLEILDPEQNDTFRDHYLDVPVDLSKVVFLTTANVLHTIPAPLRDRLEIIEIPGYTRNDKVEIARRYLIPKQAESHGLEADQFQIGEAALEEIAGAYTREAGVRGLDRVVAKLARKVVRRLVEDGEVGPIAIDDLAELLGPIPFTAKVAEAADEIGVTTGLAVTGAGGDVLFVEASLVGGSGKVTLTGQLGDVMRESAQAAITYARSRLAALDIKELEGWFERTDVHIHVPDGAVPKDGPSAGVTMTTSLVSALTGTPVRSNVAMTGEVTLRGKVLPIGGVKDKVLAAHLAGIDTVLLPSDNEKDLVDIPDEIRGQMDIRLVSHMDEVLEYALNES